jgi:ATP-dependent Clp protease ATP-binding subunit ClpB
VIIMTSNIGSSSISEEGNPEQRDALVREALKQFFRPEFLNRIDEVVIFDRLKTEELDKIVALQLERVIKRLEKQNIHLEPTEAAVRFVAEQGYDPVYGARPLKRSIQKHLLDPLSLAVLEGGYKDGDHIKVDVREGRVVFEKQ